MNNNILIVEDSKTYNNTLKDTLSGFGLNIYQAYSIVDAIQKLKEHKIEYLILDLILPDGEGDDLLSVINEEDEDIKIIVLSGTHDIQRRNYLFENGVIDYFQKDTPILVLITDIINLIKSLNSNKEKSILVIDDSAFVRKTIKKTLLSKNYTVFVANDPYEAFDILNNKNNNINLIFSDLEMPHMNGIDFLENIKENPKFSQIPVLILSSTTNRESYARVLRHGAIDFIKKPFFAEEILLKCDLHIKQSDYVKEINVRAKELEEYQKVLSESDIVSKATPTGKITYVNKKFCEISGYESYELIGKNHNIVRHPDVPKEVFEDMWSKIKNKEIFKGIIKNRRKDGTSYYVDATIVPILDINGEIKEIIGVRHDITEVMNPKKQLMEDILYSVDPLLIFLKIANYDLFREFYSENIMNEFEIEFEKVALNYFPKYAKLNKVYNLNNGLFAFFRNQIQDTSFINSCLTEVINSFKDKGIEFRGNKYDIDIYLSYSVEKKNIFDDVDLGIKEAIETKKPIVFAQNFYRRSQIEARNNLKNIQMIKEAFANEGEFVLLFQPIISNKTLEIAKYEGLIRLINKDGKVISPFAFLPISKKTGYYSLITEVVIEKSLKVLEDTDKSITINLSASDIENHEIRNKLLNLITIPKNKGRVTFELLEDENVNDMNIIKDFITLAKELGEVKIAIDDFGSGYSNYERLLDFQPDVLKIDGSLIKNIIEDSFSRNVVESIILFAKKQNIETVAEFVINQEVLNLVKEMGIDYSQGYFLGEPEKLI